MEDTEEELTILCVVLHVGLSNTAVEIANFHIERLIKRNATSGRKYSILGNSLIRILILNIHVQDAKVNQRSDTQHMIHLDLYHQCLNGLIKSCVESAAVI